MLQTLHLKRNLVVPINEIKYLQADANYTLFFLGDKQKIISSYTLKYYDLLLNDTRFRRISKSIMINTDFILTYQNHSITLQDGTVFKVARRRRRLFS